MEERKTLLHVTEKEVPFARSTLASARTCLLSESVLSWPTIINTVEEWEPVTMHTIVQRLAALNAPGATNVLRKFAECGTRVAFYALTAIVSNPPDEWTMSLLQRRIFERDESVVIGSADAIALTRDVSCIEVLRRALRSCPQNAQNGVASALLKLGGERVLEDILPLARSSDGEARLVAVTAIIRHGNEKQLKILKAALRDGYREIRPAIARNILRYARPELLPYARALLDDRDEANRKAAREAIEIITGKTSPG